jgi:hypothetical protein
MSKRPKSCEFPGLKIMTWGNRQGKDEDQYQILVTALHNKQFRVYVNYPARKGIILGKQLIV